MFKSLLVLLCMLAATATTAAAQSDGVIVDPGSPSGKEYAFPIDSAREQAAKGKARKGTGKAPLFGEGVGDDAASGAATPRTKDPKPAGTRESDDDARAARADRSTPGATATSRKAAVQSDGLGMGAVIAGGLGVLVLGGLAGLWLRRRSTA